MNSGIYRITNKFNGKVYIGSSVNVKDRFKAHNYKLSKNKHENSYLQRAYNEYWENPFIFEVMEYCNKENLTEREQHWLDQTNCCNPKIGYNLFKFARSAFDYIQSEEHKKKIGLANKGRVLSEETKKKISEKNKGYRHTKEAKLLISAAGKGNKYTLGRKLTYEHKQKLSEALKGKEGNARDFSKWPCKLGSRCRCDNCRVQMNFEKNQQKITRKKSLVSANVQSMLSFGV